MSSDNESLTFVETARRRMAPPPDDAAFPNFDILAELGRGSGGRVYLARQSSLSDRLVVLKVIPSSETEHLSLARLQHTNIVPLYDAFHDRATQRRALCMPYFGSTTLFHIFDAVRSIPLGQRRGSDILSALDRRERDLPAPLPAHHAPPEWQHATYAVALCHLGAALAQALADAHDRGLLHLDIKPSNVLLTVDGQPMLLDFHLARPPLAVGDAPPILFGGSPPFMSPEQSSACRDVTRQTPIAVDLDARADIYSLAMLLYVGLADDPPPGVSSHSPTAAARLLLPVNIGDLDNARDPRELIAHLRNRNPQVSVGLADILARCLAPEPGERYQTARHFAEDLRRHAHSEPLAHVANRSLTERWRKWRRRRPYALAIWVLAAALTGALLGSFIHFQTTRAEERRSAETLFLQGQIHLQDRRFDSAIDALSRAQELLPTGNGPLRRAIDRDLASARRAQQSKEATDIVDAIRIALLSEPIDYRALIVLDVNGKNLWIKRGALLDDPLAPHDARLDAIIRRDLTELALDWADIHIRLAPAGREDEYRAAARNMLEEAREVTPSQRIIDWRLQEAGKIQATSPWEWYCSGQSNLRDGKIADAFADLQNAVRGDPADYWSNFILGVSALKLGRPAEALAPLSVCIGARPLAEAPLARRGRALAALKKWDDAIRDFDRALRIRPNMPEILIERGKAHLEAGDLDSARDDFRLALDAGAPRVDVEPLLRQVKIQ